jgi:hypothetical protein
MFKVGDRPAEKAFQQLNADIFEKLLFLFRNAHTLPTSHSELVITAGVLG